MIRSIKFLKPIFFASVLFVCTANQCEEGKCKYKKNEKGHKIVSVTGFVDPDMFIAYEKKPDSTNIVFILTYEGEKAFEISQGKSLKLTLTDGKSFSLKSVNKATPTVSRRMGRKDEVTGNRDMDVFTNYSLKFNIKKSKMKEIAEKGFKSVKVEVRNDKTIQKAFKKRKREKVKATAVQARCVLGMVKEK